MTDEAWTQVMDATLTTMRMTRAMLGPCARSRRDVNNASVLGWRAQKEQSHYAGLAGVMALTRCAVLKQPSLACG